MRGTKAGVPWGNSSPPGTRKCLETSMVCKLAEKAIFEDGLGLLSDQDRTELADHCKLCEPCRQSWRSSSALDAGFLALRSLPAPAVDIHQDVLRQIRTIPPAPARGFAWALAMYSHNVGRPMTALTLVLFVLCYNVELWHRRRVFGAFVAAYLLALVPLIVYVMGTPESMASRFSSINAWSGT